MDTRPEFIRSLYLEFLDSPEFEPFFAKIRRKPFFRWIFAVLFSATIVGLPIGIVCAFSAVMSLRHRAAYRIALREAAARSDVIMTYPVMANTKLYTRPGATAPALVIGSFVADKRGLDVPRLLVDVFERFKDDTGNYRVTLSDDAAATIDALLTDDRYVPHHRTQLPLETTEDVPVYAFNLLVVGGFLPTATLELPLLPCLAEPGDDGMIQMIPAWIVKAAMDAGQLQDDMATSDDAASISEDAGTDAE
ncbi:MAG: hypothetical protein AAF432_07175 [Planctomycetota bacterium]